MNKVTPLFKNEMKLVANENLANTNQVTYMHPRTNGEAHECDTRVKNYESPVPKNWRVTYEVLFVGNTQPTRTVVEFHYFETAIMFLKQTEKHQNVLFFNIEKIN